MGLVETETALSVEVRKETVLVGNQGWVHDNDPGKPADRISDPDGVVAGERRGGEDSRPYQAGGLDAGHS
jgi:hypothetical protein